MSEPLPELLDCRHLAAELGVTRAAAEAVMRRLPVVMIPGLRKVFVKRSDVAAYIAACTYSKDQVPRSSRIALGRVLVGFPDKTPPTPAPERGTLRVSGKPESRSQGNG